MTLRTASKALRIVPITPPIAEREPFPPAAAESASVALEWSGTVRLDPERAQGLSAAQWQGHIRTGLLERAVVLGADHWQGPHRERPMTAERFLAHLDALAEAGLGGAELVAASEALELDRPGTLWALTLLFGCLDDARGAHSFEEWVTALDPELFGRYDAVVEIAEAIEILPPGSRLREHIRGWLAGNVPALVAVAIELARHEECTEELAQRIERGSNALAWAALARCTARAPRQARPAIRPRRTWLEPERPSLAFEMARATMIQGNNEPLDRLRARDVRALEALGPFALDVLALGCDAADASLALDIAAAQPTTPESLQAMGRIGLGSLFPRLLAELSEDFAEDAEEALVTALGDSAAGDRRPRALVWQERAGSLGSLADSRLRYGEAYGKSAIVSEARRPGLSGTDIKTRAAELVVTTRQPASITWATFDVSLDPALSELARIFR